MCVCVCVCVCVKVFMNVNTIIILQEMATKHLGFMVLTRYNNWTYRIMMLPGIGTPRAPSLTTPYSLSPTTNKHMARLFRTQQPLLIHRPKRWRMEVKDQEAPEEVICLSYLNFAA